MIFNLSQDKIKKINSVILIVRGMNLWELIRTSIMEDINEHEIDGLIQTMKETGIKGLMKYISVFH